MERISSNDQISKPLEKLFIKGANKTLEIRISEQSGRGIFALQNMSPGIFAYTIMEDYVFSWDDFVVHLRKLFQHEWSNYDS